MNKLILTLIAIMTLGFVTCAQNNGKNHMQNKKKALVVYFLQPALLHKRQK